MADSNTVVTTDVIRTLWDAHSYLADMKGFGKGTEGILGEVPETLLTESKTPSEAFIKIWAEVRRIIDRLCVGNFKGWMNTVLSELIQDGLSNGWTIIDIMRRLNRIVSKQHALDGKLFEAIVVIILTHFLGKDNITISTQVPTGADLGGHLDVEVKIGKDRFLIEVKTQLGSDWKRSIIEHLVDGKQQPYFLLTDTVALKPHWVEEMKKKNCQPVSINPSLITGVVHLDALVNALKKEIERAQEQSGTMTV